MKLNAGLVKESARSVEVKQEQPERPACLLVARKHLGTDVRESLRN